MPGRIGRPPGEFSISLAPVAYARLQRLKNKWSLDTDGILNRMLDHAQGKWELNVVARKKYTRRGKVPQ